jgi:hypothetical protein
MSETTPKPARPLSLAEAVVPILALILSRSTRNSACAGCPVPRTRGFGHRHLGPDPLEQLRRLHGGRAGVATLSYAPFTFFNILNPLISILFGFAGIRMLKRQPEMAVSGQPGGLT